MHICVTLKSGNKFYFIARTKECVEYGFVVSTDNKFLGGFAGKEATRKYKAFRRLEGTREHETFAPSMKQLDYTEYLDWIPEASRLFTSSVENKLFMTDNDSRNGGQACDERMYYFQAVGIAILFKQRYKIPVWIIIANHLSIFGKENFKATFSKTGSAATADKDDLVFTQDTRYSKKPFKAPAAYLYMSIRTLLAQKG